MKYKALVSFVGAVSMAKGEIREIADSPIIDDLLSAKYIEPVEERKKRTVKKGE